MTADFLTTFQSAHLAIWNEKDVNRRKDLMKTFYSENIQMFDKDFVLSGIDEISNFITKLLTDDPAFFFTAQKDVQVTQSGIRLFWNIKTSGPILTRMDFFIIKDEKVKDLYVFMD